jgi:hypothetical protein
MYLSWRRQQLLDDYRDTQKECACENNSDLCNSCQAREAIGMAKTPRAAWAAVAYQKESIAKFEGRI